MSATQESVVSPAAIRAGTFPLRYHVEGNAFVDELGQKMVFRGIASHDPVIMDMGNPIDPRFTEDYFRVIASWGANIIRVPIVPYSLHKTGLAATLSYLDQTIAWAGENKLYVIIDFHSIGWLPGRWYPDTNNTTSSRNGRVSGRQSQAVLLATT
jgi:endoglucanase